MATTGSLLNKLMQVLSAFFKPTTGQISALQFPGPFLQQDLVRMEHEEVPESTVNLSRPTVPVYEREFRKLVDQLYNVGQVIGAPNGINLSLVHEQRPNNLIPGVQTSAINFQKQPSRICDWLFKDVPTNERMGQGSHRSSAHHGYYG